MCVGQRTEMITALRAHLAEHGVVAASRRVHLNRLVDVIEDGDMAVSNDVRSLGQLYLNQIEGLSRTIPASGCPQWPPAQARTSPKVGARTPCRDTTCPEGLRLKMARQGRLPWEGRDARVSALGRPLRRHAEIRLRKLITPTFTRRSHLEWAIRTRAVIRLCSMNAAISALGQQVLRRGQRARQLG